VARSRPYSLSFPLPQARRRPPLFPYTTLFRSYLPKASKRGGGDLIARADSSFSPIAAIAKLLPKHNAPTPDRRPTVDPVQVAEKDRKSTRLNSSHVKISYALFCLKKKQSKIHQ